MSVDNVTPSREYPLPFADNKPSYDVGRLIAAFTALDLDVAQLFTLVALKAALASPAFEGNPTAPTQPVGTNNNTLATTGHVQAALSAFLDDAEGAIATITELQAALSGAGVVEDLMALIALKAPLESPALTGTPTAPTAAPGTNTAQLATTAFVEAMKTAIVAAAPTTLNTLAKLAASIGNDANFIATVSSALSTKAGLESPAFTGNPTVPTQGPGNNTTRAANTAFVKAAVDLAISNLSAAVAFSLATKASLASPAFEGNPTVPTQAEGNNSTRAANTAFVGRAVAASSAFAILQDRRPAGTDAGGALAGAWYTRTLNAEVSDISGFVSLAGNAFTVTADCLCEFWSVFHRVGVGKCRIWNMTDAVETAVGSPAAASSGAGVSALSSGACVLVTGKQYRMEYRVSDTQPTNGQGLALDVGIEVYAQVLLRRF
jgi:hypothetical protein